MALSATTDAQLSPQNVRELETNLHKLWNLGANLFVGWRTLAQGIEVLYIPSYNLPLIAKSRPDILRSDRHITEQSEYDALLELGCRQEILGMMFIIREKGAEIDEVNEIIRNFTVTHFESRAVALFDIVRFSVYSPYEQITQISILSYPPFLRAWTIPLSTRRSSTRAMPRVSVGKNGPIRAHCASENQKKSDISIASSLETMNHASPALGIPLTDIPQMTSKFAGVVLPIHRHGNSVPFVALRCGDFGGLIKFGTPFGKVFHHLDAPLPSFSPLR